MDTSLTMIQIIQPLIAIFVIWRGSAVLVENSLKIGKKLGMSELLIGLTFIAWGTSLPEFFVMLNSILFLGESAATLSYGTVLGSNIANISLVLGIGIIASNGTFSSDRRNILLRSLIIIGATLCLVIFPGVNGAYKQTISIIIVITMFLYIGISLRDKKHSHIDEPKTGILGNLFWLVVATVGIYFGSSLIVSSGQDIMSHFGWSATAIGTIFFALSTSSPEICATLISVMKFKKTDLAIGNVIGSNISNIFLFGIISALYNLNLTSSMGTLGVFLILTEILLLGIFILYGKKHQIQIPSFVGIFLVTIYYVFIRII